MSFVILLLNTGVERVDFSFALVYNTIRDGWGLSLDSP